ncbi:NDR1/HIN1-like protein 3 [Impatiens glandulifera]|uniref:NDR1/HIN1-like protein 3 n=1 Tax=Impatiens glandulifera TaxID=253017 RepID=UPI001FB111F2|nr:NDR1/HIN1-like protein 3 [Impatiens glandulifera]
MTNSRQPHLNGAFYGPSIPPPSSNNYHHPIRGGGGGTGCCCCCDCLGCLCSCICNLILQILCTILLILGVIVFVLWLIFRPNKVKFYADDASLTRFDLSSTNNTLYYNLSLNLTIRNPNKRVGIYYDSFETNAYYENQRFATELLTKFYQGKKNTTSLEAEIKGQNLLLLQIDRTQYNSEKKSGVFSIELKLRLRVRLKAWWFKSPRFTAKVNCDLKVPMNSTFESKRCDIDW